MRNWLAVVIGFAGALVCAGTGAFAQTQTAPGTASAEVRDANRQTLATAELREQPDQVVITLTFQHAGALTGTHAVHLHEHGQCDPPDFASAGGILNPLGKQHGLLNPGGPMAGDLPDLVLGPQGLTRYSVTAPAATLRPGPASLVGTALVVDAGQDDNRTQPEGHAGPRIACGVIVATGQAAPATAPGDAAAALVIGVAGMLAIVGGIMLRRGALSRRAANECAQTPRGFFSATRTSRGASRTIGSRNAASAGPGRVVLGRKTAVFRLHNLLSSAVFRLQNRILNLYARFWRKKSSILFQPSIAACWRYAGMW